jgi:hypothetical protein
MNYGLNSLNGIGRTLMLVAAMIGLSAADATAEKDPLYQKTTVTTRNAGQLPTSDSIFESTEDPQHFAHNSSITAHQLYSGFAGYNATCRVTTLRRLYLAYLSIRAPPSLA